MTDEKALELIYTYAPALRNLKRIQQNSQELYYFLINRYNDFNIETDTISELIYRLKNHIETKPVCKVCDTISRYDKTKGKYLDYCCRQCFYADMQSLVVKSQATKLKRYGNAKYSNRDKAKQTMIEKYGTDIPLRIEGKAELQKETYRNTCIEKYGVTNTMQLDHVKEKSKKTCLNNYGVQCSFNAPEVQLKIKETMLTRYGAEHALQNNEIKKKTKQTCIERYGVDNPMKSLVIKEKVLHTCLKKYGVLNPMQNQLVKDKAVETCNERYNTGNPMQDANILHKAMKHRYDLNDFVGTSKLEKEILSYLINEIDSNTLTQYKSKVYPYFCDFYIPKFNMYIELQGLWTHGKHPYNPDTDNNTLNIWKEKAKTSSFYKTAIHVWTISDVEKRNTAHQNNLNYLELFVTTLDEAKQLIQQHIHETI